MPTCSEKERHGTAGTANTGTGTSVLVPVPGKILGHGTRMLGGTWKDGGVIDMRRELQG